MAKAYRYLEPRILDKITRLELRAKLVVEGFVAGMHRSPYRGASVEFAQHREYAPGDDLRFLDWKVFARTDRFYVKEFEEETNLRAVLFLDQSRSMEYASEGRVTKFEYAATLSASLAYLLQRQADAVGLELFAEKLETSLPPQNSRAHLGDIFKALEEAAPTGGTALGRALSAVGDRIHRKGVFILVSDLFDDVDSVLRGLKLLRHRNQDVLVFHVMDPDEVEFPFHRMTLFEGLEGLDKLLVDPRALREAYLAEVRSFQEKVRRGCLRLGVDYQRILTNQPLDVALSAWLAARADRLRRRK